jgi:hypothetical protein
MSPNRWPRACGWRALGPEPTTSPLSSDLLDCGDVERGMGLRFPHFGPCPRARGLVVRDRFAVQEAPPGPTGPLTPPDGGVNSSRDLHEAPARGRSSQRNHVQRPNLDAPPRQGRQPLPDGGGRDRGGFGPADQFRGYHSRAGEGVGFQGCGRPPQDRKARSRRERLSGPVSLRASTQRAVPSAHACPETNWSVWRCGRKRPSHTLALTPLKARSGKGAGRRA